jgi:predicted transcriptional regulator
MQEELPELGRRLDAHMRVKHITQASIAKAAKVNQATVSRFVNQKKPPQRVSFASLKLCKYATKLLDKEPQQLGTAQTARNALELCLNRSDVHAKAASKVLVALAELCSSDDEEVASG